MASTTAAGDFVQDGEGLWHPEGGMVEDVTKVVPEVVPKKLGSAAATKHTEILPFETFALSDEGTSVKLYFGLKNAKNILPPESVTGIFRVQALEVLAELKDRNVVYRCHESILYEHIVPEKCKIKIKTDHILVIMPKVHQNVGWQDLGVNRKAIGPVRKSPPDFGRPVIVKAGSTASSS